MVPRRKGQVMMMHRRSHSYTWRLSSLMLHHTTAAGGIHRSATGRRVSSIRSLVNLWSSDAALPTTYRSQR
jgi:hypothetical protein